MLNPVLLAAQHKSFNCLKYFISQYNSLRQCMQGPMFGTYSVALGGSEAQFDNLILPLLIKNKANDILAYLLKQDGFIFSQKDVSGFFDMALSQQWTAGIKNILWSHAAHVTFQGLKFEDQTAFVEGLVTKVDSTN